MKKAFILVLWVFVVSCLGGAVTVAASDTVERVTTLALNKMLDNPDVIVVDVRAKRDWDKSDKKIKGAVREDPGNVSFWMSKYPSSKTLVFYCA